VTVLFVKNITALKAEVRRMIDLARVT